MLRVILGVIIGFFVWSFLWVGSDELFSAISPNWYGKHQSEFEQAINSQADFSVNSTILILGLFRSVLFSIIAGFITALTARENTISTFLLGILLLLFGIFIQSIFWNYVPLWYHISFLLLLIPTTVLGGKLKSVNNLRVK